MDINLYKKVYVIEKGDHEFELIKKFNTSKTLPLKGDSISFCGIAYKIIEIEYILDKDGYDFSSVNILLSNNN